MLLLVREKMPGLGRLCGVVLADEGEFNLKGAQALGVRLFFVLALNSRKTKVAPTLFALRALIYSCHRTARFT